MRNLEGTNWACAHCYSLRIGDSLPITPCHECKHTLVITPRCLSDINWGSMGRDSNTAYGRAAVLAELKAGDPVLVFEETDDRIVFGLKGGRRITLWGKPAMLTTVPL